MIEQNPAYPDHAKFDNAYQHRESGEMFVPSSDGSEKLVETGWYFELVTQWLPPPQDPNGVRLPGELLSPWAFATKDTADRLVHNLVAQAPGDVLLTVEPGDANTQFPFSHDMLQIVATRGDKKARVNAGLLASGIARTTSVHDGVARQSPARALYDATRELLRELEHVDD